MKCSLSTRDWLIDSAIVIVLTCISVWLLPTVTVWFAGLSLRLGRTLFWVHFITLGHLLPHAFVGSLLGLSAAWLIRHQKLSLALLPAALHSSVYSLFSVFGPVKYPWGQSTKWDFIIVGSWFLLIVTALLCARVVLRHRHCDYSAQPTAAAPAN